MSSTDPAALAAAAARFPALQSAVERAVEVAGPYLADAVGRAAPTPAVLKALGDELARARRDPKAVAHPELTDPDTYWAKAAWPQAAAVVKQARGALLTLADELGPMVQGTERVLEAWLDSLVAARGSRTADDAAAARDEVIDAIAVHCEAVHRTVERLLVLAPSSEPFGELRAAIEATRDDASFRHKELLLTAHERAAGAIAVDVHAMVRELTEPILRIGERLVRRHDEMAAGRAVPTPQ